MALVDGQTGGDPMGGRTWVRRSLRNLSSDLRQRGHRACPNTVRRMLRQRGYSLRSNVKRLAGLPHPDRERQFQYLQQQRQAFQAAGLPVLSVDGKDENATFYCGGFDGGGPPPPWPDMAMPPWP